MMLVGEQPGDQEDKAGKPFVGPAGRLLDKALTAAEIDRGQVYLTNAVKHFKFEQRGKRRIHKTPNRTEVVACQPWLLAEINAVRARRRRAARSDSRKVVAGQQFSADRSPRRGASAACREATDRPGRGPTGGCHRASVFGVTRPARGP